MIPTVKAKEKPLSTSPPKTKRANTERKVMPEVIIVLESV